MVMSEDPVGSRRRFLGRLVGVFGVLCAASRRTVLAEPPVAVPPADTYADALRREVGTAPIETTDRIAFTLPPVAEDGAVVPVSLESLIAGTDRLVLLAEKNPLPLLAAFRFAPATLPFVTLRVKLQASGEVVALARANGRYYQTKRIVRVVVGGCG